MILWLIILAWRNWPFLADGILKWIFITDIWKYLYLNLILKKWSFLFSMNLWSFQWLAWLDIVNDHNFADDNSKCIFAHMFASVRWQDVTWTTDFCCHWHTAAWQESNVLMCAYCHSAVLMVAESLRSNTTRLLLLNISSGGWRGRWLGQYLLQTFYGWLFIGITHILLICQTDMC